MKRRREDDDAEEVEQQEHSGSEDDVAMVGSSGDEEDPNRLREELRKVKRRKKRAPAARDFGGFSDAFAGIKASTQPGPKIKAAERALASAAADEREKREKASAKRALRTAGHDPMPRSTRTEEERGMQKIATRGVVKLFNAVREAQKGVEVAQEERVSLHHRKAAKISKDKFLGLLKGGAVATASAPVAEGSSAPPAAAGAATGKKETRQQQQQNKRQKNRMREPKAILKASRDEFASGMTPDKARSSGTKKDGGWLHDEFALGE